MIQDIGEHTFDNQYHPCPPDRESYALYYEDHAALVRKYPDRIEFPKFRDIERLNEDIYEDAVYLFSIDGERYYLVEEINRERQSHFTMENTEIFRYAEPQYLAFAGITGYQLHNWYQSRRFCGKCGRRMKKDSKERMLYCESCHNMEFPKICPAVIIGVTDGDKILISEGCTHHRQCGDIGTEKLPNWIREYTGKQPEFHFTSGTEFPEDVSDYKLIIHCGGCMLNEREMRSRLRSAADQEIPMTNYGIAIAYMKGILERSVECLGL